MKITCIGAAGGEVTNPDFDGCLRNEVIRRAVRPGYTVALSRRLGTGEDLRAQVPPEGSGAHLLRVLKCLAPQDCRVHRGKAYRRTPLHVRLCEPPRQRGELLKGK